MIETRRCHYSVLTWSHSLLLLLLATMNVSGGAVPQSATAPSPLPLSPVTPDGIDFVIFVKATAIVCAVLFITVFSVYLNYWTALAFAGQHQLGGGLDGVNWRCSCSRGIDREVLDTFPILVYSTIKNHKIGKGELECAVCLSEFEDHETLRLIPKCNHVFHPECIDAWLASHVTCPICRANLKPDSGEVAVRMPTQLNANELSVESGGRSRRGEASETQYHQVARVPNDVGPSSSNSSGTGRATMDEARAKQSRDQRSRWRMFEKFPRSNSTGHSLVEQPRTNNDTERYTLRLPEEVRRYILMNHAAIGHSVSYHGVMKGVGWSDSEGSSRGKRNMTPASVHRKD
ncbi:E3 ubiquitin-protein ligase ATL6-like [Prosopis cineraria]|uniref:E3 ubiquitin-protein ligase ATL6-like n=1 Tax=Prosopis cineraria TaxID=364024 RepID=UPI00241067F6|nr:E3 ubiquitin-protein ligase ATL6-like [Prosopis cineraria]